MYVLAGRICTEALPNNTKKTAPVNEITGAVLFSKVIGR